MTQESTIALRASKNANIIKAMCELSHLSLHDTTDIFYKSETAGLIEEGVADLQCRSDKYLATIILEEYHEFNSQKDTVSLSVPDEGH